MCKVTGWLRKSNRRQCKLADTFRRNSIKLHTLHVLATSRGTGLFNVIGDLLVDWTQRSQPPCRTLHSTATVSADGNCWQKLFSLRCSRSLRTNVPKVFRKICSVLNFTGPKSSLKFFDVMQTTKPSTSPGGPSRRSAWMLS
jgi:hypothetical protein